MKRALGLLCICVLLMIGCIPARPIESPTETSTPSKTPIPSSTVPPTKTLFPSRTPMPSATPTPSLTPSITSTAVPPLIAHKWQPKSVLVKLDSGGGDGCCTYSYPPELVLYANGRIIIDQGFDQNGVWRYQPMTKVYSRSELCSVMNTIDQTGFLYYDTSSYRPQGDDYFSIAGAGYITVTINAWRSNFGEFFALSSYLNYYSDPSIPKENILSDPGFPVILPALRDVYYFLATLAPNGLEVYQPQRLGLIVTNYDATLFQAESPIIDWPFKDVSLSEIENATTQDGYPSKFFVVEGKTASSLYEYFGNSYSPNGEIVKQNGQNYVVFLRPLLPYEIPKLNTYNIIPDPAVKAPDFELECFPSDGVLPIPKSLHP